MLRAGSDIRENYQYRKMPPKLSTYVKFLHNKRILIFNWESRGPHPIEEFSSDRRFLFFLKAFSYSDRAGVCLIRKSMKNYIE